MLMILGFHNNWSHWYKKGGLTKNHFWLVATQKNSVKGRVLNPFLGQKIKEKPFSDGKSRGPLLARAALNIVLLLFFLIAFIVQ